MDLKKKFRSLINEIRDSSMKSPEDEEPFPTQLIESPAVAKFKEHLADTIDPQADRELIASIEGDYFQAEGFDASQHELQKLPDELSMAQIDKDRKSLKSQLHAVSRKFSELVLENHPAYATELQRVMELQRTLVSAQEVCQNSRQRLGSASDRFTSASLGLLANYRKRQQLLALLKSLRTIKTLQRTDIRLREMLEEEDYPGAIQLCLECQKAASTLRHYQCISELSSKLQYTLEMIEESLDVALSKTCNGFDESHYSKVQTAYRLLGKTQTAMDQLHMHFTSAIHNTAFQKVLGYVELCSGSGDNTFQKRQYADLCTNISHEVFTACLIDLSKSLWEVMRSYYKTMKWHGQHQEEVVASDMADEDTRELNKKYIDQKLEHGLVRIWGDVQQKVKVFMLSTDLSSFKYDEFIQVLDLVKRLMQVGEEFCGSASEGLQESIRKQSLNYFRNYHRARMDELRMFLENEGWELCPVKSNFSILMLQEFKFLRNKALGGSLTPDTDENKDITDQQEKFFEKYIDDGSPFDATNEEEEREEDVLDMSRMRNGRSLSQDSDSDDDIPEELKQDYVDENTGEIPINKVESYKRRRSREKSGKAAIIVTNTTLNVCRLFGKYMQMMNVLKPIAFDVMICMSQLFDYYLYTVYTFFATDMEMNDLNEYYLSSKLRTTLKRITDALILPQDDDPENPQPTGAADKIGQPHISSIVNLNGREGLHGLSERVVATESLVFLSQQFEFMQSQLEAMIPVAKKAFLQQFYSHTVNTAQELRKPVYRTVAIRAVDYDNLLNLMLNVKWDLKDIMSQHSQYVDAILQDMQSFQHRLDEVSRRTPIPTAVNHVLWEHCIRLTNRTFVEGYAGAKKCSNEGRALMQLDFQQYLMKLEKLTDLRPIPDRDYVESYIKAYYLPENQFEGWIREHKLYTCKQLIALVSCVAHINKRGRQKLVSMIEDLDKSRR